MGRFKALNKGWVSFNSFFRWQSYFGHSRRKCSGVSISLQFGQQVDPSSFRKHEWLHNNEQCALMFLMCSIFVSHTLRMSGSWNHPPRSRKTFLAPLISLLLLLLLLLFFYIFFTCRWFCMEQKSFLLRGILLNKSGIYPGCFY